LINDIDSEAPLKPAFSGVNPFTFSENYSPLREGVKGMAGQVGTLLLDDQRLAVYDFDAPVWEVRKIGGGRHMWPKGKCLGHPEGSCNADVKSGSYCDRCSALYAKEGVEDARQAKRDALLDAGITGGWLPASWRLKAHVVLTADQARAWLLADVDDRVSVYLYGGPGKGKTTLALEMAYTYHQRCRPVACVTMGDMRRTIDNPYYERMLKDCDLLVVDDVDKQLTPFTAGQLHAVLSARHDAMRRTIVTSEKTIKTVQAMFETLNGGVYGQSTLDRLSWAKGKCVLVEVGGDNLRR